MKYKNIDLVCADKGREIAENQVKEKLINGALNVLHENGLYALFLYFNSRKMEKEQAETMEKKLAEILETYFPELKKKEKPIGQKIRTTIADRLNSLFFAKDLVERTLIYARYHAKALETKQGA